MSRLSEILGHFLTVLVLLSCLPSAANFAQDARELEAEKVKSDKLKGEHPLVELMRSRKSALRPELRGVRPRVYVTDKELDSLRERARTTHRELWQLALRNVRAHHNTVLVGGRGQGLEGEGHDPWIDVPYDRLNKTRITHVNFGANSFMVSGDATDSYMPEVGLRQFERRFEYSTNE